MSRPLLVWDGDCGFCSLAVAWVRGRDQDGLLEILSSQECSDPPLTPALREQADRELLLIEPDGRVRGGAEAVLSALARLPGGWWARPLLWPPFIWIMTVGYRLVARNRGWISQRFLRGQSCQIPRNSRHKSSETDKR